MRNTPKPLRKEMIHKLTALIAAYLSGMKSGNCIEQYDACNRLTRHCKIRFTAHFMKNDRIQSHLILLTLPIAEYAKLVEACMVYPDISFNTIFRAGHNLHLTIHASLLSYLEKENQNPDLERYPFFITMDEAKEDAERLMELSGENPETKENPVIWRLVFDFIPKSFHTRLDFDLLPIHGKTHIMENFLDKPENDDDEKWLFHTCDLERIPLNTILDTGEVILHDPDFIKREGEVVYEAYQLIEEPEPSGTRPFRRITVGYFTQMIEHPVLENTKWAEWTLSV